MNTFEKIYSFFAIIFATVLISCLLYFPALRELGVLLPLSFLGLTINIGLMFIVLRDVFSREFAPPGRKYTWIALVLLLWPSILYYLPKYAFQPRKN